MTHLLISLQTIMYNMKKNALDWIKRIGNLFIFAGCVGVGFSPDWSVTIWPFILYTVGNVIWLWVAYKYLDDKPLMEMNLFFVSINGFAIYARV